MCATVGKENISMFFYFFLKKPRCSECEAEEACCPIAESRPNARVPTLPKTKGTKSTLVD
jgi:hypothetical protein